MSAMPSGTANGRLNESGSTASAAVATVLDGEQHGGPAGEDAGAEQGDAEEQAAEQVAGAGEVEQGLQVADVAGRRCRRRRRRRRR